MLRIVLMIMYYLGFYKGIDAIFSNTFSGLADVVALFLIFMASVVSYNLADFTVSKIKGQLWTGR